MTDNSLRKRSEASVFLKVETRDALSEPQSRLTIHIYPHLSDHHIHWPWSSSLADVIGKLCGHKWLGWSCQPCTDAAPLCPTTDQTDHIPWRRSNYWNSSLSMSLYVPLKNLNILAEAPSRWKWRYHDISILSQSYTQSWYSHLNLSCCCFSPCIAGV